jgi:hypothetical protein
MYKYESLRIIVIETRLFQTGRPYFSSTGKSTIRQVSCANLPGVSFVPTIVADEESMFWKIVLVLGILGVLLGVAVTGVSVALPLITDGRTSWDEAAFGIIPGALFLVFSFFVFAIGLIFVIKNRKKKSPNATPAQFGK